MESAEGSVKQTIWLGNFEVVDITLTTVVIDLGRGVHIHVPTALMRNHQTKRGDKLPLYTELSYARPDAK